MKSLTSITLLIVLALAAFVSGCGTGQVNGSDGARIEAATSASAAIVHQQRSDTRAS